MKKLFIIIGTLAAALFLVSCSRKEKLQLFIPNEYIDEELVKEFEKAEGVRVNISTFDNNEVALNKMQAESYDLVVPSDYAIEELAKANLLEEINYKEILGEDFEFTEGLADFLTQLKDEGFDMLKYAVPYFWGSVGILYNHNNITQEIVAEQNYNIIGNKDFKTVLYDSSRDAFMVGLLALDPQVLLKDAKQVDINKAKDWLISTRAQKNTQVLSDEILSNLDGDRTPYDAVIAYSGDAAYIMSKNPNYSFHIPSNTNVWADGFVIPKNSKNPELAKKFITFMNTYESSLANTIEVGYSSSRKEVFAEMITGEGDYAEERLRVAYESKVETFQIFRSNEVLKDMISAGWQLVITS